MSWKSVVWAWALVPALAGCGALRPGHTAEVGAGASPAPVRAQARDGHRRDAQAAWRAVRDRYPAQPFTDEFRDGFLDGYAEYLARTAPAGGDPGGRDYHIGFRYAAEVAVASGRQPASAAPPQGAPAAGKPAPERAPLAAAPEESDKFAAPLPKPELPVIKPFNPPLPDAPGQKLGPLPVPPSADRLPAPNPPLSVPLPPPAVRPLEPAPAGPSGSLPAPTILDDLPVIPPVIPGPLAGPPK